MRDSGWMVTYARDKYSAEVQLLYNRNATIADVPMDEQYLAAYWMAIGTLISGTVPTELGSATIPELFFGVAAVVTGGFV